MTSKREKKKGTQKEGGRDEMNALRHKAAGASEMMRVSHGPRRSATVDSSGGLEPMESLAVSARLLVGVTQ